MPARLPLLPRRQWQKLRRQRLRLQRQLPTKQEAVVMLPTNQPVSPEHVARRARALGAHTPGSGCVPAGSLPQTLERLRVVVQLIT